MAASKTIASSGTMIRRRWRRCLGAAAGACAAASPAGGAKPFAPAGRAGAGGSATAVALLSDWARVVRWSRRSPSSIGPSLAMGRSPSSLPILVAPVRAVWAVDSAFQGASPRLARRALLILPGSRGGIEGAQPRQQHLQVILLHAAQAAPE